MLEALITMMICGGSFMVILLITGFKLLQLPLITNIIYIKLGTQSVTQVITEISNLKAEVPTEITTNLVAISESLQEKLEAVVAND